MGQGNWQGSIRRHYLIVVQFLILTSLPTILLGKNEPRQVTEFDVPAKLLFKTALHVGYAVSYADHEMMSFNFKTRGMWKFEATVVVETGEAGKSILKIWVGGKTGLANIGKADRIAKRFVAAVVEELKSAPPQQDKPQQ